MTFYRRHLPHWIPPGKDTFITWRLAGSVPREPPGEEEPNDSFTRFRKSDECFDKTHRGPTWLARPEIARMVVQTPRYGAESLGRFDLHAFVVMSNHVHVLIHPKTALATITQGLKGYTARRANEILKRKHQAFWHDESFDHWVRSPEEFRQIVLYIEHNPVTVGLVERPEDWPWSSATRRTETG
jgi:REP element-mobilizing transposase RayT